MVQLLQLLGRVGVGGVVEVVVGRLVLGHLPLLLSSHRTTPGLEITTSIIKILNQNIIIYFFMIYKCYLVIVFPNILAPHVRVFV